jgi:D-glycero-alpha-D-manno-heptose-7-phosphate kinase
MTILTCRTPLRVSFFGGGTDYPEYFDNYKGAVLGMSIDKYVYTSVVKLEKFMGYGFRLAYRITEEVDEVSQIQHPMFRAALDYFGFEKGFNFSVLTSLPSQSGLGSSSSFAVGLVQLLGALKGISYTRYDLASLAIKLEREVLMENVGVQDQLHAAFGGLNRYEMHKGDFSIHPIRLHNQVRDMLNSSMFLIHTGIQRYATQVLETQIKQTKEKKIQTELSHLYSLAQQGYKVLEGTDPEAILNEIGQMLSDAWLTKRSISSSVSSPEIDAIYETAMASGAVGGKLCGAGGGGFFLVLIPPEKRQQVQDALKNRDLIPIRMDDSGSTLLRG